MPAQRGANPRTDFRVFGFRLALRDAQERTYYFAVALVWEADDAGFRDGRVAEETLFDFGGEDVLTAWGC